MSWGRFRSRLPNDKPVESDLGLFQLILCGMLHMCAYTHGGRRSASGVAPQGLSTLPVNSGSPSGAHCVGGDSRLLPQDCFRFLVLGYQEGRLFLCEFWRTRLRSSRLPGKKVSNRGISLTPLPYFNKEEPRHGKQRQVDSSHYTKVMGK